MTSLSFEGGVSASYSTVAGQTTLTISSRGRINQRAAYFGTGQMLFHWVQEGKTQAWRCDSTIVDPRPVQAFETVEADGSQVVSITIPELYPAGLLLQGKMEGILVAPAVHLDVPWWADLWVFFVKSPWFSLKFASPKTSLSVVHKSSQATAAISPLDGGAFATGLNVSGSDFKSVEILVRRTLGERTSTEQVFAIQGGSESVAWKPILRSFDMLLVFKHAINQRDLIELGKGLGAQIDPGFLGGGSMEGDFILADGPAFTYSAVLKGHAGLLDNVEDSTDFSLRW